MFIKSLKVGYPESGWELEETNFDQFNLLVGASGVGKTRILQAILDLTCIAMDSMEEASVDLLEGFNWDIKFTMPHSNKNCHWQGTIIEIIDSDKQTIYFNYEKIWINGELILDRKGSDIAFKGKPTPKLSKSKSCVFLLMEEDSIGEIYDNFLEVIGSGEENFEQRPRNFDFGLNVYENLDDLINSSESLRDKLWWLFIHKAEFSKFNEIVDRFKSAFPLVEAISMIKVVNPTAKNSSGRKTTFHFEIHEKGVDVMLDFEDLSLGMQRTLDFLGQIYLLPENSVILIDEFENSLGVNCINFVADAILNAKRGLQFIITSHHPYIINNVDFKHWKIVTRKGSVVAAQPAKDFGLGKSKHERFFQLTNMEAFRTGQTPEPVK